MSARKADEPQRELPANIEAEQALLGSILIDNRAFDRVSGFLEPDHFLECLHQAIYERAGELIRMGKVVNPVLLKTYLPKKAEGLKLDGKDASVMQYLARLASEAVGPVQARELGIAIHEAWMAREAISAALSFLDFAYTPSTEVVGVGSTEFEDRLAQLRGMRVRSENRRGIGQRYLDNLTAVRKEGNVQGVPIALKQIQRVISEPAFEAGNYYGLLSSSGEGKTSLMLQLVTHALQEGHPVQIQSYDQSPEQFVRQMVAQQKKIEARRQRFGDLGVSEWNDVATLALWLDQQPFEVIECTNEGAAQLAGYARTFVRKRANGKTPFIVTDHAGAITPDKADDRADEGTKAKHINGILKAGAKSIGAAWLTLNQRNTRGMVRDNPRPIASDLYGGEGAKQAYDACFYLYRFLKFYNERKATAATEADFKKLNNGKAFPSAVREGQDIAEIGAVKVRFGDPALRETLDFNARFTLLESHDEPPDDQEAMSFLRAV